MANADEQLASHFEQSNWLSEYETQHCSDYDITLLGVVSGNEISVANSCSEVALTSVSLLLILMFIVHLIWVVKQCDKPY